MSLYRMIYCSRARELDEGAIRQILDACERNNPRENITGMLLFTSDYFVQLLEGSRANVSRRFFTTIAADTRHSEVEIMSSGTVDFRLFERWSMHYVPTPRADDPGLRRFSADSSFNPYGMSSAAIERFCIDQCLKQICATDSGARSEKAPTLHSA